MSYELSADVGGTFTDLVLRTDGVKIDIFKSSTTPDDVSVGIMNGIHMIAGVLGLETSSFLGQCTNFACGTTIATNAILEGKQAKTGLICTEGFRDTLLIREGGKPDSYDFYVDYPPPYIPRYLTIGVPERVNADGIVEQSLDEDAARTAVRRLRECNVQAVAVSLLWSIVNPEHELRIGRIIEEEMPGIRYSLGHMVNPSIREYRRTSAVSIDASLKPVVETRINAIEKKLRDFGFSGVLTFITSSGGRVSPDEVIARPILLCLSGPSVAPQAGCRLARQEGVKKGNILTTDMGGTSFEVSVSVDWKTPMHREGTIGSHSFGVPSVEISTIGSGGGSIAYLDAGGLIHVGPESAGAIPGPACYGRGGTRATVTDANVLRGYLVPKNFANGQFELDIAAAERAIKTNIADPLGLPLQEAADLICLVAEQNMVSAIRDITIKRGVDPRHFTLVSGGAAGGLHAATIAAELGIKHVLIPRAAGVLSAYGIMTGPVKMSFARSHFTRSFNFDFDGVNTLLGKLKSEGEAFLDRMNIDKNHRQFLFAVEARYAGQVWQITLPFVTESFDEKSVAALVEDFHELHEKFYEVRSSKECVEFTEWGLDATTPDLDEVIAQDESMAKISEEAHIGTNAAWLRAEKAVVNIPIYDGAKLRPGNVVEGPALVQETVTVNFIPSNAKAIYTFARGLMISLPENKNNQPTANEKNHAVREMADVSD